AVSRGRRSRVGRTPIPSGRPGARSIRDRLPVSLALHPMRDRRPSPEAAAHIDRSVVVLHDVTKVYPNGKVALRDVDLLVPEGDFVFLVGPSGADKSTLIKLLIRDELTTRGEVVLDGEDLAGLPRRHLARA